ncbi:hypothetical protein [Paenibacillus maysiensis]|uniref:hypothetical protein n=1 Tax=Paenibacillus maysiensis TaxID=1155954 RepID=UPI0004B3A64E|nr:hypothetical protein [Paenibacillus maysiensis]
MNFQFIYENRYEKMGHLYEQELALNNMTYGLGVFFAKDAYEPDATYRSNYV